MNCANGRKYPLKCVNSHAVLSPHVREYARVRAILHSVLHGSLQETLKELQSSNNRVAELEKKLEKMQEGESLVLARKQEQYLHLQSK